MHDRITEYIWKPPTWHLIKKCFRWSLKSTELGKMLHIFFFFLNDINDTLFQINPCCVLLNTLRSDLELQNRHKHELKSMNKNTDKYFAFWIYLLVLWKGKKNPAKTILEFILYYFPERSLLNIITVYMLNQEWYM